MFSYPIRLAYLTIIMICLNWFLLACLYGLVLKLVLLIPIVGYHVKPAAYSSPYVVTFLRIPVL